LDDFDKKGLFAASQSLIYSVILQRKKIAHFYQLGWRFLQATINSMSSLGILTDRDKILQQI